MNAQIFLFLSIQALFAFGGTEGLDGFCKLQPETGPCRAYMPSYYYDVSSKKCKQFIYGGCRGNKNRFSTLDECDTTCGLADFCKLSPVTGLCKGYFPKFYYDAKSNECKTFTYGGCGGNGNRFSTREKCESKCVTSATGGLVDTCKLQSEAGPCRAYMPSYYYDVKSKECKQFIYGGCRGNDNRFSTREECQRKCGCSEISCKFGGRCKMTESGKPKCDCLRPCPLNYNPVCDKDGKVYANSCALEQKECEEQREINVASCK